MYILMYKRWRDCIYAYNKIVSLLCLSPHAYFFTVVGGFQTFVIRWCFFSLLVRSFVRSVAGVCVSIWLFSGSGFKKKFLLLFLVRSVPIVNVCLWKCVCVDLLWRVRLFCRLDKVLLLTHFYVSICLQPCILYVECVFCARQRWK